MNTKLELDGYTFYVAGPIAAFHVSGVYVSGKRLPASEAKEVVAEYYSEIFEQLVYQGVINESTNS